MAKGRKYNYNRKSSVDEDIFFVIALASLCLFFNYWQYILVIVFLIILVKIIIFIHDKDLFSKFKENKLYYQGESSEKYLERLE